MGSVAELPPSAELRADRAVAEIRALLSTRHRLMGGDPRDPLPEVNAAFLAATASHSALVELCVAAGLFTAAEYRQRVADEFEAVLAALKSGRPPGDNPEAG